VLELNGIEAMETIQFNTVPELDDRIAWIMDHYYSDVWMCNIFYNHLLPQQQQQGAHEPSSASVAMHHQQIPDDD
jgi:hypothetical protein